MRSQGKVERGLSTTRNRPTVQLVHDEAPLPSLLWYTASSVEILLQYCYIIAEAIHGLYGLTHSGPQSRE
mgnify:CR=1 FL=1